MQEISLLFLVMNASLPVQLVMLLLALFSISSWAIILGKWLILTRIKLQTHNFINEYNKSTSVVTLYNSISLQKNRCSTSSMFFAGISEYNRLSKNGISDKETIMNNVERALSSTIDLEVNRYEKGLSTLATFGSVSPYIGLLGTVWGIMHSFVGLSNSTQSTLAAVAPGIAEALIATAIGLFVAIPAYIAFNKFSSDINNLYNKMNYFGDDFLNLISRKLSTPNPTKDSSI